MHQDESSSRMIDSFLSIPNAESLPLYRMVLKLACVCALFMKKGTHNAYQMSTDPSPIRPLAGFGPAQPPNPASAPGGSTLRPGGPTTRQAAPGGRSPRRAGGGGGGYVAAAGDPQLFRPKLGNRHADAGSLQMPYVHPMVPIPSFGGIRSKFKQVSHRQSGVRLCFGTG